MILIDTSVWVDHLHRKDKELDQLLEAGQVLTHPLVIGEIALGSLRQREVVLRSLLDLPQAAVATSREVLEFIDQYSLFAAGIGYVDVHLLASARLTAGTSLWSRDRRLMTIARRLDLAGNVP